MRDKSGDIPIGGVLKPQAIAAAGNATGAWVDARTASWWVALLSIGAGGHTLGGDDGQDGANHENAKNREVHFG